MGELEGRGAIKQSLCESKWLQWRLTCRISVPIVICPWGELVTLLSVRHFTTMDVDDMDTCTGLTGHMLLIQDSSLACAYQAPMTILAGQARAVASGMPRCVVSVEAASFWVVMKRWLRESSTHQRAHKDSLMHRCPDQVSNDPRCNDEEEDLHHAPCKHISTQHQASCRSPEAARRSRHAQCGVHQVLRRVLRLTSNDRQAAPPLVARCVHMMRTVFSQQMGCSLHQASQDLQCHTLPFCTQQVLQRSARLPLWLLDLAYAEVCMKGAPSSATLRTALSLDRLNSRPNVNSSSCTPTCARDSTCTSSCTGPRFRSCQRHGTSRGVHARASRRDHAAPSHSGMPGGGLHEIGAPWTMPATPHYFDISSPICKAVVAGAPLRQTARAGAVTTHLDKPESSRPHHRPRNEVAVDDRLPQRFHDHASHCGGGDEHREVPDQLRIQCQPHGRIPAQTCRLHSQCIAHKDAMVTFARGVCRALRSGMRHGLTYSSGLLGNAGASAIRIYVMCNDYKLIAGRCA